MREKLAKFYRFFPHYYISPYRSQYIPVHAAQWSWKWCNQWVWNKILNIKSCMGQISGTWELFLCEYWRKNMIIGEKNMDLKRLKLRFLTEMGRFHWNQGEEVAHFAWFGEPWPRWVTSISSSFFHNHHTKLLQIEKKCSLDGYWQVYSLLWCY